jgi:predicted GTPase
MAKIKITSNPYIKQIQYHYWNDDVVNGEATWKLIDYANNPNSKLISDDLTVSFFPFKANEILDTLIDEFNDGSLEIFFAGTEDEFIILKSISEDEKYSSFVSVCRDSETLENARDILPDIVDLFKDINPLISQSVRDKRKIETELAKFSEATNENIPICVVGNYSAGKSSFINALIGHEILPSGDEPVTARIYKISPSHYSDRGRIRFTYDGTEVTVKFRGNNQGVDSDLIDHPLIKRIEEVIAPLDEVDLVRSINRTLQTINNCGEEMLDDNVSDLIEIEVPFNSSMYGRGKQDFVIFDTPGSNSASNSKHVKVLKQAMENMSNGLPIFVSELNSLDSMDNDKLYKDIASLEELDNRFTMVVVNKSDKANLPQEGFTKSFEERILSMAIPKNLYSGGIYFVSSVIGLGAKTKGVFDNEFYEEIFEDTIPRFSDPSHKRYKSLYKYNIMPDQLKKEAIEESEECDDLILANSGIYCVEQEINAFAAIYSAYNKCIQSELFLSKVFNVAREEIEEAKKERENSRQYRSQMLDKDKKTLVESLESTAENLKQQYINDYGQHMRLVYQGLDYSVSSETLKSKELMLKQRFDELFDVDDFETETKESTAALFDSMMLKKNNKPSFKSIARNYSEWRAKLARQSDAEKAARQKAVDELFGDLREQYKKSNDEIHGILAEKSQSYWELKTQNVRDALVVLVSGSSALTDSRKKELENLILQYEAIKFEDESFDKLEKDKFEMKLFSLFAIDPLNINRYKLAKSYNSEIANAKEGNLRNIYVSHVEKFTGWVQNLTEILLNNIIEINPVLSAQAEIIKEETEKIQELELRQRKLEQYVNQIHKMMLWRDS